MGREAIKCARKYPRPFNGTVLCQVGGVVPPLIWNQADIMCSLIRESFLTAHACLSFGLLSRVACRVAHSTVQCTTNILFLERSTY